MPRMTGGQALIRSLVREGVEVIFGLPGVQMYGIIAAIRDEAGIRMITTRSEGATTYMADGYARAGRRAGVALVVPGPGVYNAAGGLSTAYSVSSPVLLIAGQIPVNDIGRDRGGLHEVNDQMDAIRPVTKWQARMLAPADVPGTVHEAFRHLRNGRPRPVHIEMPPEAMLDLGDIDLLEPAPIERGTPPAESIKEAARLLASAANPAIYAGSGIHLSGAHDELRSLAESYNLPVLTSRGGKGVMPHGHPLHYGAASRRTGRLGEVFSGLDVVLAVGTRLAIGGPTPDAKVIQIDPDPEELGRFHENTLALIGDAKATLPMLHDALAAKAAGHAARRDGSPQERVREARDYLESPAERTQPQDGFIKAIRTGLPDDGIAVLGMTQLGYYGRTFWPVYEPRTYIDSGYSGNLGFALPTALGVKVAQPERPVVCVSGDGGFGYHTPELSTAVKYGINVVTVLFNDGAYGNVARDLDDAFDGAYEADLVNPDYMKLADAYGLEGMRCDDHSKLAGFVADAVQTNRPVLIEVPVGRMPKPSLMSTRAPWATPRK